MKKLVFALVIGLSACSTEALINTAYPDRERFSFRTSDGEDIFTYVCEPQASESATKTNARTAHRYFDRGMSQIVDRAVGQTLADENTIKIYRNLDRGAEAIVEQTEERYQCLFIDGREA